MKPTKDYIDNEETINKINSEKTKNQVEKQTKNMKRQLTE